MIQPDRIGHVVLKVRDLKRSEAFYTKVLGLVPMGTLERPRVLFLSCNAQDHHEIGLVEIGPKAVKPKPAAVGMAHVAFRLKTEDELRLAYRELKEHDVPITLTVNHGVSKSVYFLDPDGNELEVYVDNPSDEVRSFENPYAGVEKLDFAPEDPGFRDLMPG
jgi:catechol 2,3-dioxygenase